MSRELEMTGTAVYGTVCAVVWEDGGREPSSYPIGQEPIFQPHFQPSRSCFPNN